VLIAGLKEWYNTDQPVRAPLMNSIKVYTADKMMPLKKEYNFSFIGLLVSEEKPPAQAVRIPWMNCSAWQKNCSGRR
jgi:hypothetical protein